MPATVTLSTATLAYGVDPRADEVTLSSVSGVYPGFCLFIDQELMTVLRLLDSARVKVGRGIGGTPAQDHSSSATVYIGKPEHFYSADPIGVPSSAIPVSPYINVLNGRVFLAQGDAAQFPGQQVNRWWQPVETTYGVGPLAVRFSTQDPTSSS